MSELIGIAPAAGMGKRMWPYNGPKELLPVGYHTIQLGSETKVVPMVVGQYVLRAMQAANVNSAYLIVSLHKWEILKFFMSGAHLGMHLGYLYQDELRGMPAALDIAYPWVRNRTVLMGMPDTILEPTDCFVRLLDFHVRMDADLSLGVFPTQSPESAAPVHIDAHTGRVIEIFDKPALPLFFNTWGIAIWKPVFTELLHDYVQLHRHNQHLPELLLSDVFSEAIRHNLNVCGYFFEDGKYYDVGTTEGLINTRLVLEHKQAEAILR